MQESSVYQHVLAPCAKERYRQEFQQGFQEGIQQGIEEGSREANIRHLLTVFEFRFDGCAVHALRPAIESIRESLRLEGLIRPSLHAETFEDFARALGAALVAQD